MCSLYVHVCICLLPCSESLRACAALSTVALIWLVGILRVECNLLPEAVRIHKARPNRIAATYGPVIPKAICCFCYSFAAVSKEVQTWPRDRRDMEWPLNSGRRWAKAKLLTVRNNWARTAILWPEQDVDSKRCSTDFVPQKRGLQFL